MPRALISNHTLNFLKFFYVVFMLYVFIGFSPFKAQKAIDFPSVVPMATTETYTLLWLAFALGAVFFVLKKNNVALNAIFPPKPFMMFFGWVSLSLLWSLAPYQTLQAEIVLIGLAVVLGFFIEVLGVETTVNLTRKILFAVLILNLLAVYFIPEARHLETEGRDALIGDWRGVFIHKNYAGAVAGASIFFFLDDIFRTKNIVSMVALVFAIYFLLGTNCKSAINLTVPVVILGLLFNASRGSATRAKLFNGFLFFAGLGIASIAMLYLNEFQSLFNDSRNLTGRIAIWQTISVYIQQHFIFGSGYNAFWHIGVNSPILRLTDNLWIISLPHAHNGYIEIILTTGAIGLALGIYAIVFMPLKYSLESHSQSATLLFMITVFFALLNLAETYYLQSMKAAWVLSLLPILLIYKIHAQENLLNSVENYNEPINALRAGKNIKLLM
jgi:exopolysaccharide production protein ExoQ